MNFIRFFTPSRAGLALLAAASLTLSTVGFATTDPAEEGGAGQTSGTTSSGSGYTVPESTAATATGALDRSAPGSDAGGSGTTGGSAAGGQGATLATEIKGTIDSIDAARRQVTVRDSQGNLASYKLVPDATVQVGGHKASLAALIKGDVVTISPVPNEPGSAAAIKVGG